MSLASVAVGADPCTVTFLNQTACVCTLTRAPSSQTPIVTYTYAGQSATITVGVTAPFLSSLQPPNGPTGPSYNLTLTGLYFGDGSQLTFVSVGTRSCTVLVVSATTIICQMPSGAVNTQLVQVTVGSQPSNSLAFQFDPPFVTAVIPNVNLSTAGSQSYGSPFVWFT
jgi:hypothetical protein